jgi:hypothetical protein
MTGSMDVYKQTGYDLSERQTTVQGQIRVAIQRLRYKTYVAGPPDNHGIKRKVSHVADTDASLPDKLNIFFTRFQGNNIEPPMWAPSAQCVLSFSVDDVSKSC